MNRKTLIVISIVLLITGGFYVYDALIKPKKTKEIVIYTSNSGIELMLKPTIELFTERTGVEVSYVFPGGSGAVCNKIIAEKDNPVADIAIASLPSMLGAKNEGALEKYVSPETEHIVDAYVDADGYFAGYFAFITIWAYNPDYVTSPPQSFTDFLNPEYEGKIVYPDPNLSGSSIRFIAALVEVMGEDNAFEFLAQLEPNVGLHPSHEAGELVDKGEFWIHITDTSVMTAKILEGELTNQKMLVTEEGVISGYVAVAITKNAPHMEEAKAFVDLMLSKEGQLFTFNGYGVPCRDDIDIDDLPDELADIWAPCIGQPIIPLDWQEIADKMSDWKARWTEEVLSSGG